MKRQNAEGFPTFTVAESELITDAGLRGDVAGEPLTIAFEVVLSSIASDGGLT